MNATAGIGAESDLLGGVVDGRSGAGLGDVAVGHLFVTATAGVAVDPNPLGRGCLSA